MKTTIKFFAFALFLAVASFSASAQVGESSADKTRFSIEIDPATFAFKGYSAHLRIQPKHADHLLLGLGAYAMDMPSFMVNLNANNKNRGWDVRLNRGLGLFGEYHFSEVNKKWFVGSQVSLQQYNIEREDLVGSSTFSNALAMGYAGYTVQPFSFPVYFKLWAGLGYTGKISGENAVEGQVYDIAPITTFATLHIGYTFN